MASATTSARTRSAIMGPPEEVRFDNPNDWSQIPFYFILVALGLVPIALVTFAQLEHGGPPALVALPLLVPLAWFAWRVFRYVRDKREFRFGLESVEIPRLSLFGRPRRIAYRDVDRVECHKWLRLHFTDGSSVRLSIQAPAWSQIVAAMQLRVGHALERRGEIFAALDHYRGATDQHEPPLDARIGLALWKSGYGDPYEDEDEDDADIQVDRQGEILTHLHVAALEHVAAFGADHPMTVFLRGEVARFRREHPAAVVDESLGDPESLRRERLASRDAASPPVQDRWAPKGAGE